MEKVAKIGRFTLETNGVGEIFLSLGKTKLRISGSRLNAEAPDIQITFSGNGGEFIPDRIGNEPVMTFRGNPFLKE